MVPSPPCFDRPEGRQPNADRGAAPPPAGVAHGARAWCAGSVARVGYPVGHSGWARAASALVPGERSGGSPTPRVLGGPPGRGTGGVARRGSDAVSGRAPSPASDRPADAPRTRAPRGPHDRLVSIVTPSLNQGPFIEDTIRSVLTQSTLCSTTSWSTGSPRTRRRPWSRATRTSSGTPSRITADRRHREPRRASRAGAVLGWLNSDDCYEPGAVGAAMLEYLDSHPEVDLVYGDCVVVYGAAVPPTSFARHPFRPGAS